MEYKLPVRVYIEDTDAGGIVFYVNYLKYMERARTEFMRESGIGKRSIFSADLMFVVKDVNANFIRSARLDDEIIATAKVIKFGGANIVFEQLIMLGDELLCRGEVKIVCVDKNTQKPARMPVEIKTMLKETSSGE